MELVYLWVENYKNIKNQGFNFSPRFRCEFKAEYKKDENGNVILDEEKSELIFCDKKGKLAPQCKYKNYIEDFFGENINITAIVGKNGSGKSSVLEIIADIILKKVDYPIIFVFYEEDTFFIVTNIKIPINSNNNYKIVNLEDSDNYNIFSIFYSSNFTNGNLNKFLELFSTPVIRIHSAGMSSNNQEKYKNDHFKNQSLLNLVFNASRIIESHPTSSAHKIIDAFTIEQQYENYEIAKVVFILGFLKLFGKNYLPLNIKDEDMVSISIQHNSYTSRVIEANKLTKVKKLLEIETIFTSEEDREKYNNNINEKNYLENYNKLLKILEKSHISNDTFELNINDALDFIEVYLALYMSNKNLQETSIFNFKFKHLSSGEENLILMYALLEKGILSFINKDVKSNTYNILLLLDEVENNLHPYWQKNLFNNLLIFLNIIQKHWKEHYSKKIIFTILISSHSPFLLSDIPKQNIIFLDTDENGNCKVVDGLNEKKETFGANIHTLLSDSFFMEDGLMGEFAKSKINEIIDFHKKVEEENKKEKPNFTLLKKEYEDKKDKFWQTQSIIGEEYLKQIIKNHLVDIENILLGFDEAKQEEIKRVEAYLESLKND